MMREALFSLLCFASLACANDEPIAEDCNGVTFLGFYANENEAFVGIRYGRDTGGENRFKPPQRYHYERNETVHATDPGPMCPQPLGGTVQEIVHDYSEDCLRLNIMRPNGTTAKSHLPVMVFIHGGSFFEGSKDDFGTEAGGMILQSVANGHPIMHVRINYRLGIFGFAQSEALRKEGSENAGLKDQRLALEWVKDNIEAFGGDPSKITISGQSSGGISVGMQIVAYGGTRPAPFQRGICQSQLLEQGVSANFTQNAMERTLNATTCNQTNVQSVEAVACLRNLLVHDLFEAQNATSLVTAEANLGDEWLPSVDGDFIPALPSELVDSGRFSNVSMIIGWTDDDMKPFVQPDNMTTTADVQGYLELLLPKFSNSSIQKILDIYPVSEFHDLHYPKNFTLPNMKMTSANGTTNFTELNSSFRPAPTAQFQRATQITTDLFMVCIPLHFGKILQSSGKGHIYYYHQNRTFSENQYPLFYIVPHASEIPYVIGNISAYTKLPPNYDCCRPGEEDKVLQHTQSGSWGTFTALGKPSVEDKTTLQGWKEADFEDDDTYGIYVIGSPFQGSAGKGGNEGAREEIKKRRWREKCGFWNSPEIIKELGW